MRNLLPVVLVLLVASFAMAAGGGESAPAEPETLVMAIWGGDNDIAAFEAIIDAARPEIGDVDIEVLLLADYDTTVTTRLVGGEQIDIMGVSESIHQFSTRNQLEPLNDLISAAGIDLDARFGVNQNLYSRDGTIFALPLRGGPMVVYANMDVLTEKPSVDWTFEQLVDAAVAAYQPGPTTADTIWGFVPAGDGTWWPWYTSFIYAAGGSILDEAGDPNFDDPNTVQGLANYASFITEHGVGPSLEEMADIGQTSPDPVFNSGKAAMITTGWWNVGSLQNADFNWDVAAIPNGNGRGTVIFGQGLAVTASSEFKEAAFNVVAALTNTAAQEAIVNQRYDIPSNVQVLNSPVFLEAEWSSTPLDLGAVADAISQGAISLPYGPQWNQMHDVIGNVVNELLAGNTDAQSAADRIQDELTTLVFN